MSPSLSRTLSALRKGPLSLPTRRCSAYVSPTCAPPAQGQAGGRGGGGRGRSLEMGPEQRYCQGQGWEEGAG